MKRFVIVVEKGDEISFPKSSCDIGELKSWIHKRWPTAYQLPVVPSEVFGKWYVCKYSTHFIKNKYSEKPVTIYIKRTF